MKRSTETSRFDKSFAKWQRVKARRRALRWFTPLPLASVAHR